ncbi:MAG: glycosyltransferase family 39 protein [Tepidisphaeraceae bacterium]
MDCPKSAGAARKMGGAEFFSLALLLAAGVLVRLAFWPHRNQSGDAIRYSIAALTTHVAHPPGYVGYCLLGGGFNHFVHHIQATFHVIDLCATMVGTIVCYCLAKAFGLRWPAALATAACYCFSINTLICSLYVSPYGLEGMFSALFGLLCLRALRGGSHKDALGATLIVALAGAFRPSTTLLLAPAWLYVLLSYTRQAAVPRGRWLVLHATIALPIVLAWTYANNRLMTQAGYGGRTYDLQVMQESSYDYASFHSSTTASHHTYHMPMAEILAWVENKTGFRLLPHVPDWPTPSLTRAARLAILQSAKQAWWILLSLPSIAMVFLLLLVRRRQLAGLRRTELLLLGWWILPGVLFFVMGHLGTLGYVQIYLPALCVATAYVLLGKSWSVVGPNVLKSGAGRQRSSMGWFLAPVFAGLLFFAVARPFAATSGWRHSLNIIATPFTGYSIRTNFGVSRNPLAAHGEAWVDVPTDEQLIAAARKNHFSPI